MECNVPNGTDLRTDSIMEKIEEGAVLVLRYFCGITKEDREHLMPLMSGRLLEYITNELCDNKLSILGAHDTTVYPMLVALKVSEDILSTWPPFCAHIDFEFLS